MTSRELLNHHTKSGRSLSRSVHKIGESTAAANHSLYNLERANELSAAILNETHQKTQTTITEISRVKTVLGQVSTNTADTADGVQRIEIDLADLQDKISATSLISTQSNQNLTRDVLQQIDAGFSRQADAQAQAHPLMLAGFAQLLEAAFEKDRKTQRGNGGSVFKSAATMTSSTSHSRNVRSTTNNVQAGFEPAYTSFTSRKDIGRYEVV